MEIKKGFIRLRCILASLTFYCETFLRNFPRLLMAINEETTSCKITPESPRCSSLLIGEKILIVNFHHEHSIVPTNCLPVSKDVSLPKQLNLIPRSSWFNNDSIIWQFGCTIDIITSISQNSYKLV